MHGLGLIAAEGSKYNGSGSNTIVHPFTLHVHKDPTNPASNKPPPRNCHAFH